MVDSPRHVRQQIGVPEPHPRHQRADFRLAGDLRPGGKRGPGLEVAHVSLFRQQPGPFAGPLDERLVKMVVAEHDIGPQILDPQHRVTPGGVTGRPAGPQLHSNPDRKRHMPRCSVHES